MSNEDALLKEYEVCQSHNNSLSNQSWISISVLITVNMLVLAGVISQIVLNTIPIHEVVYLIMITLLALLMVFILAVFWRWQKRIRLLTWLNNHRMQEIEEELDFKIWKNWRVRGLDLCYREDEDKQKKKWDKLNPKLKEMIQQLREQYPQKDKEAKENENYKTMYRLPTTEGRFWKGQFKFEYIFPALMIFWGFAVIAVLVVVIAACINS